MKISNVLFLAMFIVSTLALAVASQISQVTSAISVEEGKSCNTIFYNENQDVYGNVGRERNLYENCLYYSNYTHCLNTSGVNTDCSIQQRIYNISCITGTESYQSYEKTGTVYVLKNKTECKTDRFTVSITKGFTTEKKEIDFSQWGACIQNAENNCLVVTCVSNDDGAFKGQFTDCKGGKSCQKFEICDDKVRVFYKNSRKDFVEEDTTFYLSKLALKEVGQ